MKSPEVLVCSVDSFSDCWTATLACLKRYWSDCPWRVRTMSNQAPWGTEPLLVGEDRGWVANLRTALGMIEAEYLILWLEDMILCREVHTANIRMALTAMDYLPAIGAIRLGQGAETLEKIGDSDEFYRITLDSPYRISTAPTLWRKSYLLEVLADCGETAWDFEVKGTQRSRTLESEIWAMFDDDVKRPFRTYYTGITRGRWNQGCLDWLKSEGIKVDVSRGVNS